MHLPLPNKVWKGLVPKGQKDHHLQQNAFRQNKGSSPYLPLVGP